MWFGKRWVGLGKWIVMVFVLAAAGLFLPAQAAYALDFRGIPLETWYEDVKEACYTKQTARDVNDEVLLYEEADGKTGTIIGSVPLDRERATYAKDVSWFLNDEAKSLVLHDTAILKANGTYAFESIKGAVITLWDSPSKNLRDRLQDDYTVIIVREDLPGEPGTGLVIPTIEDTYTIEMLQDDGTTVPLVDVYYMRKDGLAGKVSTVTSGPLTDAGTLSRDALPPDIVFYENKNSDVCQGVKGYAKTRWDLPKTFNFKEHDWLDNDEVAAIRIFPWAIGGVEVALFDDPQGKKENDHGYLYVYSPPETIRQITDLEGDYSRDHQGIDYHYVESTKWYYDDDLNGHVSRMEVYKIGLQAGQPDPWFLELEGAIEETMGASTFASGLSCQEAVYEAVYAGGEVGSWSGPPLYCLLGRVDDGDPGDFNEELAAEGYTVTVTSADGQAASFDSTFVKSSEDGIILANRLNEGEIPEDSWPLKLTGSAITVDESVYQVSKITLTITNQADLWSSAITLSDNLQANRSSTITVQVYNGGAKEAANFEVVLYADEEQVGSETVDSLAPGAETVLNFAWTPEIAGRSTLRAVIDPDYSIVENNKVNNKMIENVQVAPGYQGGEGDDDASSDSDGGGGSDPTAPSTPVTPPGAAEPVSDSEVNTAISRAAATGQVVIEAPAGRDRVALTLDQLAKIGGADRPAAIKVGGVEFVLPQRVLTDLAGADTAQVEVAAEKIDPAEVQLLVTGPELRLVGDVLELTATAVETSGAEQAISSFAAAIRVVLPVPEAAWEAAAAGRLDAYRYNEATNAWDALGGTYDAAAGAIVFTTDHLSKYALLEKVVTSPSSVPQPPAAPPTRTFADIQGHWAQKDIEVMAGLSIARGVGDDKFNPDGQVTRAEFAALLIRSLGIEEVKSATSHFKDVPATAWHYGAIEAAYANGLVAGYGGGTFGPDKKISREEIAVMVVRALAKAGQEVPVTDAGALLAKFKDAGRISAWAKEAAAQAVSAGIVGGRGGNMYAPQENATRAEAVVMLKRMLASLGSIE